MLMRELTTNLEMALIIKKLEITESTIYRKRVCSWMTI